MKQRQEQSLREAIGMILREEWDPIGVKNNPPDEYYTYISGVLRLLIQGASAERLAEHLFQIEKTSMGLSRSDKARLLPIAEKLRSISVESQGHRSSEGS